MNSKTAKMLKRYATSTEQPVEELKRKWVAMNARERTQERKRILEALKAD